MMRRGTEPLTRMVSDADDDEEADAWGDSGYVTFYPNRGGEV